MQHRHRRAKCPECKAGAARGRQQGRGQQFGDGQPRERSVAAAADVPTYQRATAHRADELRARSQPRFSLS